MAHKLRVKALRKAAEYQLWEIIYCEWVLRKQGYLSICGLTSKLTYILFCAKNMNQYTDYLYIQPINDLLGFN